MRPTRNGQDRFRWFSTLLYIVLILAVILTTHLLSQQKNLPVDTLPFTSRG
jgi:hypothetical protein